MARSGVSKFSDAALAAWLAMVPASGAFADAVEWRVQDGGNGHWYAVTSVALPFPGLRTVCEAQGGHLAALTTVTEWLWVKSNFPAETFVGGFQDHADPAYAEPNGGWKWVTGEPFVIDLSYMGSTNFVGAMTEPGFDDCPAGTIGYCGCGPAGAQDALFITGCCNKVLDDVGDGIVANCDSYARFGIIEWSADCNSNGVVDFGEIRAGLVPDTNGNNIPDACECGTHPEFPECCAGDVVLSGEVNGVDLAAVLGAWGTDGGKFPRADIDGNGVVDGADLAVVLSDWGVCE
jgi:hypothetical protein